MRESEYTSLEETNVRPAQERWSMIVYLLDFRPYYTNPQTKEMRRKLKFAQPPLLPESDAFDRPALKIKLP